MLIFNELKKIIGVQIRGARLLVSRLINQFLTTLWPEINAAWRELIMFGLTDAAGAVQRRSRASDAQGVAFEGEGRDKARHVVEWDDAGLMIDGTTLAEISKRDPTDDLSTSTR